MLRIAFAAAALAAAAPVMAQPAGPPPGQRLFLSPSGEPFRGEDGLAAWFAGADADKNGVLTLTEFRDDAMRFFKVLDANGDGQVDGPENSIYERKIAPEITRVDMGPMDGPQGKRPMVRRTDKREPRVGAARFSLINEAQPVRGADADLNQRVSSEEWAKAARRRFEILDTDQDGKLTLEALRPRLAR